MKIPFHIPSDSLIKTYRVVRGQLQGNDQIIFDSMKRVTQNRPRPFIPPIGPNEYEQKHNEIEGILNYRAALLGQETAFRLMEEVWDQMKAVGRGTNIYLLNEIAFNTNTDVKIRLTNDLRWAAEWTVDLSYFNDQTTVVLDIYQRNWGEVVPTYITEYVNSAIQAYKQGMYAVTIALLSISVEGTLRDVLATRGYDFNPGAPDVDIYNYAKANVGVNGNSYTLTFQRPMPKSTADFSVTTGGTGTVEIEIRRIKNVRKNRIDLLIKQPSNTPDLIEHFSVNTVAQSAQPKVGGLGEALNIARNIEAFLTPTSLPVDFDEVIKIVRNNLIHLSGGALDTPLPSFSPLKQPGPFTLKDFINSSEMVYDFVKNVPRFINEQYVHLRQNGNYTS